MIKQALIVLATLFLPSTWVDPYKDLPLADAEKLRNLTPGEAPVRLPHDHYGD